MLKQNKWSLSQLKFSIDTKLQGKTYFLWKHHFMLCRIDVESTCTKVFLRKKIQTNKATSGFQIRYNIECK